MFLRPPRQLPQLRRRATGRPVVQPGVPPARLLNLFPLEFRMWCPARRRYVHPCPPVPCQNGVRYVQAGDKARQAQRGGIITPRGIEARHGLLFWPRTVYSTL